MDDSSSSQELTPQKDDTLRVSPAEAAQLGDDGAFELSLDEPVGSSPPKRPKPTRRGDSGNDSVNSGDNRRAPGTIGPFRIVREIGRGGMGEVYEAVEDILGRHVALKILPMAGLMDDQQVRRFRNEAAAAAHLQHPNIVPVYSVGNDRGVHYYAMQLVDGRNVAQVLGSIRNRLSVDDARRKSTAAQAAATTIEKSEPSTSTPQAPRSASDGAPASVPLSEEDFAQAVSSRRTPEVGRRLYKKIAMIGREAASAIGYAHDQGVVHRDIKPSNLLLDGRGKVWITDFGLALMRDNPGETRTGDIVGTLRYMSPEQATGRKFLVDHRTDIYSLGVTLYELISLRQAFDGRGQNELLRQLSFEEPPPLRKVNPAIPVELEIIVGKAIAKNPQERYATAHELAADLERFVKDEPISARNPTLRQNLKRWINKHETLTAVIGVVLVMTLLSSMGAAGLILREWNVEKQNLTKTQQLLRESEGHRKLALSQLALPRNPGAALALAESGAKDVDGLEPNLVVQAAIDANHERAVLGPMESELKWVKADGRGQQLISGEVRRSNGKNHQTVVVRNSQDGSVRFELSQDQSIPSASFSPRDTWIVAAVEIVGSEVDQSDRPPAALPRSASIWSVQDAKLVKHLAEHPLRTSRSDSFSPDELLVVLPGPGADATVFRTSDWEQAFVLKGHLEPVVEAFFSSSGDMIVTADSAGDVRTWDAGTAKEQGHWSSVVDGEVRLLSVTHDGKAMAVASDRGTTIIRMDALPDSARMFWREPISVLVPGTQLAASWWQFGRTIMIRSVLDGQTVLELPIDGAIGSVAFDDPGETLAVAAGDSVTVFSTVTGRRLYELKGHAGSVASIAADRSRNGWVSAADDKSIRLWSAETHAEMNRLRVGQSRYGTPETSFNEDDTAFLAPNVEHWQTVLVGHTGEQRVLAGIGRIQSNELRPSVVPVCNHSLIRLIDSDTNREFASRDFGSRVLDMQLLPNNSAMLVSLQDLPTVFWNATTDEVRALTKPDDRANCWELSPNGDHFALGTENGRCQIHNSSTGSLSREFSQQRSISCVRFFRAIDQILTVDDSSTIRIWGVDNDAPVRELRSPDVPLSSVRLSQDDQWLVSYHETNVAPIACWEVATGTVRQQTSGDRQLRVVSLPAETAVAIASKASGLRIWNYVTGDESVVSEAETLAVAVSDNRIAAVQTMPNEVDAGAIESTSTSGSRLRRAPLALRLFDLETRQQVADVAGDRGQLATRIAVDGASDTFAISAMAWTTGIGEANKPLRMTGFGPRHSAPIVLSEFAESSKNIVSVSQDGLALVSDLSGRVIQRLTSESGSMQVADLSADGQLLACGHSDGGIRIWDLKSGSIAVTLSCEGRLVTGVQFDVIGRQLVSSEEAGPVRCWDLVTRTSKTLPVTGSSVRAVMSRHSNWIAVFSANQGSQPVDSKLDEAIHAVLWNPATAVTVDVPDSVNCQWVSFANDSDQLLVVQQEGAVVHWALDSAQQLLRKATLNETDGPVVRVAFSPDDSHWVALGFNAMTLFETQSNQAVNVLKAPGQSGFHRGLFDQTTPWVPFSRDGRKLAVVTSEAEVLQVPRTVDSLILNFLKGSQNVREAIVCVKAAASSAVYA